MELVIIVVICALVVLLILDFFFWRSIILFVVSFCGGGDAPPTPEEYRVLLEQRVASVDGADINIRQEVCRFENATDEEKFELYDKAKSLTK